VLMMRCNNTSARTEFFQAADTATPWRLNRGCFMPILDPYLVAHKVAAPVKRRKKDNPGSGDAATLLRPRSARIARKYGRRWGSCYRTAWHVLRPPRSLTRSKITPLICPQHFHSGRAFLPPSALGHEAVEFFPVPGTAKIVQIFGKLPLGRGKPLVFFLEPSQFARAPFVEREVPG